jgi:hypothetical protein
VKWQWSEVCSSCGRTTTKEIPDIALYRAIDGMGLDFEKEVGSGFCIHQYCAICNERNGRNGIHIRYVTPEGCLRVQ